MRALPVSKAFGGLLQLAKRGTGRRVAPFEAMLDAIVDRLALGAGHRSPHRLQFLGIIEAAPACLEHREIGAKMPVRPLEARDDFGKAGVLHRAPAGAAPAIVPAGPTSRARPSRLPRPRADAVDSPAIIPALPEPLDRKSAYPDG